MTSVTCGGNSGVYQRTVSLSSPARHRHSIDSSSSSSRQAGNTNMTTNGMVTRATKVKDQQELDEQVAACDAFVGLSANALSTSFHGTDTLSPYTRLALAAASFFFAMERYPLAIKPYWTSGWNVVKAALWKKNESNLMRLIQLPWTPLQLAAHHGSVGCTTLLLAHGADQDSGIPTALCIAAFGGHVGVADALLAKGAGVNLVKPCPCPYMEFYAGPEHSFCPILAACGNSAMRSPSEHARVRDMLKLLIDGGADVNVATETGQTPLHLLVRPGDIQEGWDVGYFLEEKIDMLIAAGADIHARDNDGDTPLHAAFKFPPGANSIDGYALLIRHGAM